MFFSYDINENNLGKEINFSYQQQTGETIFFNYFLPSEGFLLKLEVYTSGFNGLLNRNSSTYLNWNLDSFRNSKSQDYENRYTYLNYQDSDKKVRDLLQENVDKLGDILTSIYFKKGIIRKTSSQPESKEKILSLIHI